MSRFALPAPTPPRVESRNAHIGRRYRNCLRRILHLGLDADHQSAGELRQRAPGGRLHRGAAASGGHRTADWLVSRLSVGNSPKRSCKNNGRAATAAGPAIRPVKARNVANTDRSDCATTPRDRFHLEPGHVVDENDRRWRLVGAKRGVADYRNAGG